MKVHKGTFPPNIDDIDAAFDVKGTKGIIYAYSPDIYVPDGSMVPIWIVEHEKIHLDRQGQDPASWWREYIHNPKFRLEEEIIAHREEYAVYCSVHSDGNARAKYLHFVAHRLGSALYGKMISFAEAKQRIKS